MPLLQKWWYISETFVSKPSTICAHAQEVSWDFDQNSVEFLVKGFGGPLQFTGHLHLGEIFFQLFLPLTSCHHSKNGDILVKPFDSSAPTIWAHAQEVSWDFDKNLVGLPVKAFWGTPKSTSHLHLGVFQSLCILLKNHAFSGLRVNATPANKMIWAS